MARLVKCQDTGNKIDMAVAYKVSSIGKNGKTTNTYWSSKEAYEEYKENASYRIDCVDLLYSLLDYAPQDKAPTFLFKSLSEWAESYSYEMIYNAIQLAQSGIEYAMTNKTFKSEASKILYVCAIVGNKLIDARKYVESKHRMLNAAKKEEAPIDDYDIKTSSSKPTKGIKRFLEDE